MISLYNHALSVIALPVLICVPLPIVYIVLCPVPVRFVSFVVNRVIVLNQESLDSSCIQQSSVFSSMFLQCAFLSFASI